MHQLTQEMFGGDDEEYNKRGASPEEQLQILLDFFTYFSQLTASRRGTPNQGPGVGDRQRQHRR